MGNRNYQRIGETLRLTTYQMEPTKIEVEYMYYSYMYYSNGLKNYGIGILSIFHNKESDTFAKQVVNDYDAIRFAPKTNLDDESDKFSFDVNGEKVIAKSSNDNYFHIGSFCHFD